MGTELADMNLTYEEADEDDVKMEVYEFVPPGSNKIAAPPVLQRQVSSSDRKLWKFVFRKTKRVACPVVECGLNFQAVSRLLEHYKECFPGGKSSLEERCPICHQILAPTSLLIRHIREEHENNNKLFASDDEGSPMAVGASRLPKKRHPTQDVIIEIKDFCIGKLKEWEAFISIPASIYKRSVSQCRIRGWEEELRVKGACTCNIKGCLNTFTTKAGILYHAKICGFIYCYKCKPCNFSAREQQSLLKHMVQNHKIELAKSNLASTNHRNVQALPIIPKEETPSPRPSLVTPPATPPPSQPPAVPKKRGRPRKTDPAQPITPKTTATPKGRRGRKPTKSQSNPTPTSNSPPTSKGRKKKALADVIVPIDVERKELFDATDASGKLKENCDKMDLIDSLTSERTIKELHGSLEEVLSTLDKSSGKNSIFCLSQKVDQMLAEDDSRGQDDSRQGGIGAQSAECSPKNSSSLPLIEGGKAALQLASQAAKKKGTIVKAKAKLSVKKDDTPSSTPRSSEGQGPTGIRRSSRARKPPSGRFLYCYSEDEEDLEEDLSSYKASSDESEEEMELEEDKDVKESSIEASEEEEFSEPEEKPQIKRMKRVITSQSEDKDILETPQSRQALEIPQVQDAPEGQTNEILKKRGRKPKAVDNRMLKDEDLVYLKPWEGCYTRPQQDLRVVPHRLYQEWCAKYPKNVLKCPLPDCTKTFGTALGLKYHYQRCGLVISWDCLLCNKHFDFPERLGNHFTAHKEKGETQLKEPKSQNFTDYYLYKKEEYINFHEKYRSADCHPELMPNSEQWKLLTEREYSDKLPTFSESVHFKEVLREEDGNQVPWKRLERFGSTDIDSKCWVTFHTGGPVLASSWCPAPGDSDQFLALAASLNPSDLMPRDNVPCPLIQLWNMGDLSGSTLTQKPNLAFAMKCLEDRQIISLKWCPSGCWQTNTRLGLLAVAFSSPNLHIYSVPHPQKLPAGKSLPVYSAQPMVILQAQPDTLKCTCFTWDPSPGHFEIAAGFTDGFILMWQLDSASLRRFNKDGITTLSPYKSHRSAAGDIMEVQTSWSKDVTLKIVLYCGFNRKIHWWDTQTGYDIPANYPIYVSGLIWPAPSQTFFFVKTTFGATDYIRATNWYQREEEFAVSSTPAEITTFHYSPWHQTIVSGDAAGNIVITPYTSYRNKLSKRHKKAFKATSNTVVRCRVVELDQSKHAEEWRFTYDQMASSTGVVFSEFQQNRNQSMCAYDVTNYLLSAVRTVEWNPNRGCDQWLLASYTSGLCRLGLAYLNN